MAKTKTPVKKVVKKTESVVDTKTTPPPSVDKPKKTSTAQYINSGW